MPWCQRAMKDVVSCDKPRGGANILRSGDFRMGKPSPIKSGNSGLNKIKPGGKTGRTETSKYPKEEKENRFPE